MTDQELMEYLRKIIYKIEDELLRMGKINLDHKANIVVESDFYKDTDVIIYQLLSNIKAGFKHRNMKAYKNVRYQYTKEYFNALIERYEAI